MTNNFEQQLEQQNVDIFQSDVPKLELTPQGFSAPDQQSILAGIWQDFTNCFGNTINQDLRTPQGQLAMSLTAIIGNCGAQLLELSNQFDPAQNSGRFQDAIGNIYFMSRRPATASTVDVNCVLTGGGNTLTHDTIIAVDSNGNTWTVPQDLALPVGTSATIELECMTLGAIIAGAQSLELYQGGLGISSLTNPEPAKIGSGAEGRADFETRRQQTVAANATSTNASMLGALLELQDVTDAYVVDNPSDTAQEVGGVSIPPFTQYIVVEGGTKKEIGQTILKRKPAGVPLLGAEYVTVTDDNPIYGDNPPRYTMAYNVPSSTPLYVSVSMEKTYNIPSDIIDQVKTCIVSYLTDASTRIRIGQILYSSRLIRAIDGLGDYSEVMDLTIGLDTNYGQRKIELPISQVISIDPANITVEIVE